VAELILIKQPDQLPEPRANARGRCAATHRSRESNLRTQQNAQSRRGECANAGHADVFQRGLENNSERIV